MCLGRERIDSRLETMLSSAERIDFGAKSMSSGWEWIVFDP
jgi:hypothetical protein